MAMMILHEDTRKAAETVFEPCLSVQNHDVKEEKLCGNKRGEKSSSF